MLKGIEKALVVVLILLAVVVSASAGVIFWLSGMLGIPILVPVISVILLLGSSFALKWDKSSKVALAIGTGFGGCVAAFAATNGASNLLSALNGAFTCLVFFLSYGFVYTHRTSRTRR